MNYNSDEIFGKAIGQIIHDIRNSLNIIIGFSSLIQTDENIDDEIKEYFNRILHSGFSIENLLSSIDDYVMEHIEIENSKIDVISESKKFFTELIKNIDELNVKIEYLNENKITVNTSLELYRKLLDNLFHFSLKELRNQEQKDIQIAFNLKGKELVILYSDSSSPIYIADKYFTFEEILESKRGLNLIFVEKYIELLNGNVNYYYGNKWNEITSKFSNKIIFSHGFVVRIPLNNE